MFIQKKKKYYFFILNLVFLNFYFNIVPDKRNKYLIFPNI